MPDPLLTHRALTRAQQRIPGCDTEAKARAILSSAAVTTALAFGAPFVRLGTGERIVCRDHAVITVLPAGKLKGMMGR